MALCQLHFVELLITHYLCGAEELSLNLLRSLIIFDLHLQSRNRRWIQDQIQEENQSLASGGRVWIRKVFVNFVLLSLGGRRQRKADNSDSSVLLYFV
mgnify:CR=1 FL=1